MKSRKRFVASTRRQPEVPSYFVDASLGPSVARRIRAANRHVIYHHDVFPEATNDEVWLARAGMEGWVVLTKDSRLRYEPNIRNAFLRAGVRVFCLVAGNMTASEMADAMTAALPMMERFLAGRAGPFIANIGSSGSLTGTVFPPQS